MSPLREQILGTFVEFLVLREPAGQSASNGGKAATGPGVIVQLVSCKTLALPVWVLEYIIRLLLWSEEALCGCPRVQKVRAFHGEREARRSDAKR